tara:strand:- start:34221 stop:35261 length:1041 start_codon:yes stop_codon:yes gene_type:complete
MPKFQFIPALTLTLTALASNCVGAASFSVVQLERQGSSSVATEVYVHGDIAAGDGERFRDLARRHEIKSGTVYFNSVGGRLDEAMSIGTSIRRLGLNTGVGNREAATNRLMPAECLSACVMAFAGGKYRFLDARSVIAVHRFYSRSIGSEDLALGQIVAASITSYLTEMGVSPALFEKMVSVGDQLTKLPLAQAEAFGLVNNGVLPTEWSIQGVAGRVFLRGSQETWNGEGTIELSCAPNGYLVLDAGFGAGANTDRILSEAVNYSVRSGRDFIGVDLLRPASVQGDTLLSSASVSSSLAYSLSHAASIGFSWHPSGRDIFYGFSIPTSGYEDVIRSFVTHCSRHQ